MIARKQSTTTYPVQFLMVDSTDHVTAETGLSPTVTISKNGGAYGAASGAVTEVGNGVYSYAGNATDRDTLGELMIHAEATGADKVDMKVLITSYDPFVDIAAILADTGTDGVVLKAAGLAADAVTEIQNGLALEATLTAIKGAGWNAQTLANLYNAVGQASDNAEAAYDKIDAAMGAGWTNETLVKIVSDIAAISASSGATAQEVWEYATRVLTAGTNIDLSALATAANLATVDTVVDAIKAKTDTIPASPAQAGEYTAAIAAIPTTPLLAANYTAPDNAGIAAIKAKTDNLPADPADDSDIDATLTTIINHLTAMKGAGWTTETLVGMFTYLTDAKDLLTNMGGTVWANPTRTLTNSTSGATVPAQGETLEIYKDSTVTINFTGLGDVSGLSSDTSGQEDKVWFTAKKSLDDLDASSIIQIHVLYPAGSNPPDTLDYIEGAEATADEGTFQFTDTTTGAATLTLTAAATADLSIYVASPLYWDIKSLDYSTGIVNILASGQMYIYGTPTKSIS